MHTLLREFCMDQSHGRQFARPRKRGRPLTYEEKWAPFKFQLTVFMRPLVGVRW